MVLKGNEKVLKATALDWHIGDQMARLATTAETIDDARIKPPSEDNCRKIYSPIPRSFGHGSRISPSVCRGGAILFDPDTGREKVINHSGLAH